MKHVYFASCTQEGGIYHYIMHKSGDLEFISKTSCDRPMYMITVENQMHILLMEPFGDSTDSGLVTYEIDKHGELCNPSEIISTGGACACHLCAFEGKVYGVNYLSGSVFSEDGIVRTHQGHGIREDRQEMPHPHYICAAPDGQYLMVTDLGTDQIFIYDKALQLQSSVTLTAGVGPRHLAVLEEARIACVNELDCSVTMLTYQDGKLLMGDTASAVDIVNADTTSAAVRFEKPYLYVSNRGANSITSFLAENGQLKFLEETSCQGDSPRDFAIIDHFLYCTNEVSGTVTVFSVESGRLIPLQEKTLKNIPQVLCVCDKEIQ